MFSIQFLNIFHLILQYIYFNSSIYSIQFFNPSSRFFNSSILVHTNILEHKTLHVGITPKIISKITEIFYYTVTGVNIIVFKTKKCSYEQFLKLSKNIETWSDLVFVDMFFNRLTMVHTDIFIIPQFPNSTITED